MPLSALTLFLAVARTGDVATAAARKIAVVVGVSGYLETSASGFGSFGSLRAAHLDADRMAAWLGKNGWEVRLIQGFPESRTSQATKARILGTLGSLNTRREDTVCFYFSGHGIRVGDRDFLVPADGLYQNVSADPGATKWAARTSSLLDYEELKRAFDAMPAARRLVIVDACRSAPSGGKKGDGPGDRPNQAKLGEVVSRSEYGATSYAVLYSCQPGEKSEEDSRLANNSGAGVFTNALLNALASDPVTDSEGDIVLETLNRRVRARVGKWIRANQNHDDPPRMSPNLVSQIDEAIILGTRAASPVARTPDVAPRRPAARPATPSRVGRFDYGKTAFRRSLTRHRETVYSLAFSPNDSQILFSGGGDDAKLWNLATGETKKSFAGFTTAVAFSPDGSILARAGISKITLVPVRGGPERVLSAAGVKPSASLAFSPNGSFLASGASVFGVEGSPAALWDVRTGKLKRTFNGHKGNVVGVAFSPNGQCVATAGRDGFVNVYDASTGNLKLHLGGEGWASSVAFSPDGSTIASGYANWTIRLWDARTGEEKKALAGHTSSVMAVAFSPDGSTLASGAWDKAVRLWNWRNGEAIATLSGHGSPIYCVAFSRDGSTLASGSTDRTIRVWMVRR